jgi:predicted alpha/beta-hydrolase family hydrolase
MEFLLDGPETAPATVLLAHGAGAAMDSRAMTAVTGALAAEGLRVARFEFPYMAARRQGRRAGPPRAETLIPFYREAVATLAAPGHLVIGGKSMGGRVASMAADEFHAEGTVAGLVCLGYPFHPPGKPQQVRTKHLETLKTPTLIFQGTRDPFGGPDEVANYTLAPRTEVHWLEDGDHDLRPRKGITGLTAADHLASVAAMIAIWVRGI